MSRMALAARTGSTGSQTSTASTNEAAVNATQPTRRTRPRANPTCSMRTPPAAYRAASIGAA